MTVVHSKGEQIHVAFHRLDSCGAASWIPPWTKGAMRTSRTITASSGYVWRRSLARPWELATSWVRSWCAHARCRKSSYARRRLRCRRRHLPPRCHLCCHRPLRHLLRTPFHIHPPELQLRPLSLQCPRLIRHCPCRPRLTTRGTNFHGPLCHHGRHRLPLHSHHYRRPPHLPSRPHRPTQCCRSQMHRRRPSFLTHPRHRNHPLPCRPCRLRPRRRPSRPVSHLLACHRRRYQRRPRNRPR